MCGGGGGGGLRVKYLLPCYCVCHSLKFDMQHDHTLKKLNFDIFTPPSRVGEEGSAGKMFATMWLHSWFILFDMQHDHILKKLNLTFRPHPRVGGGGGYMQNICYHVAACVIPICKI